VGAFCCFMKFCLYTSKVLIPSEYNAFFVCRDTFEKSIQILCGDISMVVCNNGIAVRRYPNLCGIRRRRALAHMNVDRLVFLV